MSLSSSACPMMLCVRDHLLTLQQRLCGPLFQMAWQGLADRLNSFLYQDVSGGPSCGPLESVPCRAVPELYRRYAG